jgi:hypothetical protein
VAPLVVLAQIILFLQMSKKKKKLKFKENFFAKENEESFEVFCLSK